MRRRQVEPWNVMIDLWINDETNILSISYTFVQKNVRVCLRDQYNHFRVTNEKVQLVSLYLNKE